MEHNIPAGKAIPTEWFSHFDRYLISEGTHERAYQKLGAHLVRHDGDEGVIFAVWAPNARQVEVFGDFNGWNPALHPMHSSDTGIWTLFIPGLGEHAVYKYRVTAQTGEQFDKADPLGFAMEERPRTGSVVADLDRYLWRDQEWIADRARRQSLESPISIYEVHLGSWRRMPDDRWGQRYLTYRELAAELIPYVKEMGYTHIELLPIAEHPFDGSWGYQVLGFYAPTSRFGSPEDFMFFIDECHAAGIGVLLDWVPAHFPKDGAGLNHFDGTQLYAHANPLQGEHQDWGTLIFNYSRNEVRSFLISNALFWIDKYHLDGLRVDAVASMLYLDYSREAGQWIANEHGGRENLAAISFLRKVNEALHGVFPGVLTIAEESTSWPMVSRPTYIGGLGFSLKWNMGWMHDTLKYMTKDPLYRRFHHNQMTFGMLYAFHENFVLPLSHDEVVHGKGSLLNKMNGDEWQKFANLRAYFSFMWGYSGKKLQFMGGEFGQWQEWNHDTGLEWLALEAPSHQGVQRLVRDLNLVYRSEPALHQIDFNWNGFRWIDANDPDNSVFSFLRYAKKPEDFIVVICNFTPVVRKQYRIGVPRPGAYRELINSDLAVYGGSGVENGPAFTTLAESCHTFGQCLSLTLPPLATLWLKPVHDEI
ncbi:MAG: 1,4-alpha-glucan branching protein GlgB [Desulfobulbus sp.]|nr:1,4-alpha-glucan branching protein GlgB [Desulfobulbus sp.]